MSAVIMSHELYSSPEFIAFARKIGIPWEQGVRNLMIIMPMDGCVQVLMDFQGTPPEEVAFRKKQAEEIVAKSGLVSDTPQAIEMAYGLPEVNGFYGGTDRVDTTTEHNKEYRTSIPATRMCARCMQLKPWGPHLINFCDQCVAENLAEHCN